MERLIKYNNKFLFFFVILLVIFPIITVMSYIFQPSTELWVHLSDNLLLEYLSNTFIILISVAILSLIVGVSCAWLVTNFVFPGKDIFKWLLVMPIAIPTYVSAYIYASEERMFEAAAPSIAIVMVGLLPIYFLSRI